jgi:hypothetical protein
MFGRGLQEGMGSHIFFFLRNDPGQPHMMMTMIMLKRSVTITGNNFSTAGSPKIRRQTAADGVIHEGMRLDCFQFSLSVRPIAHPNLFSSCHSNSAHALPRDLSEFR